MNRSLRLLAAIAVIVGACAGADPSTPQTSTPGTTPMTTSPSPSSTAGQVPSSTPSASAVALPVFDADEPLILFSRVTGAGGGIFVLRPDGSGLSQLGTDVLPGVHKRGEWSPDGQRVVFIDETAERMWIASLDGSPTVAVPTCDDPGCDYPAWSPDGTRIAFSRSEIDPEVIGPPALGIYVVDLATDEVTRVVRFERPYLADAPRWSPDGRHLLFGLEEMDDEAYEVSAALAVVPVAGGEHEVITDPADFASFADWGWKTDEIVYSTHLLDARREGVPDDATWDLHAVRPDGTGSRQVTRVEPGHRLVGPRWTPDGQWLTAYDLTDWTPVMVDPATSEVTVFEVPGVETRPLLRPVP